VVAIYAAVAVLVVFVTPGLFGFATYNGVGTSMGDTIPHGSLVVTHTVDAAAVEVGDIILFRDRRSPNPITHRVIAVNTGGAVPLFRTQGDGNPQPDPFLVRGDQELSGVILTVPRLGLLLPVVKAAVFILAFGSIYLILRRRGFAF
jgi:signal peptidase I